MSDHTYVRRQYCWSWKLMAIKRWIRVETMEVHSQTFRDEKAKCIHLTFPRQRMHKWGYPCIQIYQVCKIREISARASSQTVASPVLATRYIINGLLPIFFAARKISSSCRQRIEKKRITRKEGKRERKQVCWERYTTRAFRSRSRLHAHRDCIMT